MCLEGGNDIPIFQRTQQAVYPLYFKEDPCGYLAG